jgi:hypothetical protein
MYENILKQVVQDEGRAKLFSILTCGCSKLFDVIEENFLTFYYDMPKNSINKKYATGVRSLYNIGDF